MGRDHGPNVFACVLGGKLAAELCEGAARPTQLHFLPTVFAVDDVLLEASPATGSHRS